MILFVRIKYKGWGLIIISKINAQNLQSKVGPSEEMRTVQSKSNNFVNIGRTSKGDLFVRIQVKLINE